MAIFSYWLILISYIAVFTVGALDYWKYVVKVFDDTTVEITNNGPAILDSTISFFVKLKNKNQKDYHLYRYKFYDNTQQETRNEIVIRDVECVYNVSYPSASNKAGNFMMEVTVYYFLEIAWIKVGYGSTNFNLTEYINGNLTVYNDNQTDKRVYFPTGKAINLTFALYDPNQFLSHDSIYYTWMVNDHLVEKFNKSALFNFTKAGEYTVSIVVIANMSDGQEINDDLSHFHGQKWGTFNKSLSLREPIPSINYTGKLWVKHGDLLNLSIFCNGSSPFHYCFKTSSSSLSNKFTCDASILYDTCQFAELYYFSCCDQYYFNIYIDNEVSQIRRVLTVTVYDFSHTQLSVTILPITCMVLVVVILILSVAYYKQHRRRYRVEVADFDFTHVEQMVERTFFERIFEEIKNALKPSFTSSTQENAGVQANFRSLPNRSYSNRTRRYGAIC